VEQGSRNSQGIIDRLTGRCEGDAMPYFHRHMLAANAASCAVHRE